MDDYTPAQYAAMFDADVAELAEERLPGAVAEMARRAAIVPSPRTVRAAGVGTVTGLVPADYADWGGEGNEDGTD